MYKIVLHVAGLHVCTFANISILNKRVQNLKHFVRSLGKHHVNIHYTSQYSILLT